MCFCSIIYTREKQMLRWDGTVLLVACVLLGVFTCHAGAMPTIKKMNANTGVTPAVATNTSGTLSATQNTVPVQPSRFVTMNTGIISKMVKSNGLNIGNINTTTNNNTNNMGGSGTKPQDASSESSKDIATLSDRISELDATLDAKQDTLTPGDGIKIENNTISLSDEMADLPDKFDEMSQEMATLNDRVDIATGTDGGTFSKLQNDVAELQDTIGDTSMATTAQTVTAAINELKEAISNLKVARNAYAAGVGVVIKPGATHDAPPVIGLDLPENSIAGASYVFQPNNNGGGTWTPLEVQNNWNPGF